VVVVVSYFLFKKKLQGIFQVLAGGGALMDETTVKK
jgi:hypothetical protein